MTALLSPRHCGIEKPRTMEKRESGLTLYFSLRRGHKGKCRVAPGIYDQDNDLDYGCRISSSTARFHTDRHLGEDPRTHRGRENSPAYSIETNFQHSFWIWMFLNHYTKYRFHSRDFIFLTFSLQYLEKKIFFIVFRGIEKFLRGKYFLLFHAKKSKNIEIRFFLPSINLNVYLEYRKRTLVNCHEKKI